MSDVWTVTELCKTSFNICGLTVDNCGSFYLTDREENVYRVKQDDSKAKSHILVKGADLRGIVWSKTNNNLYICDYKNHRILEYSIDTGTLSTLNAQSELNDATFSRPRGLITDKNGDLYIIDHHYIQKINLSERTVITIAGNAHHGHMDGDALQATFCFPQALVVSDDGTIYVADKWNQCVRKIKDGIVSTIAGTPAKNGYQDGSLSQSLFRDPIAIVLDVDGNLLVGDENGIRKLNLNKQMVLSLQIFNNETQNLIQDPSQHYIIVATKNSLVKLECSWKWERFLWIGNKKEDSSYCHLASVPKDIIREIANYVRPPLSSHTARFVSKEFNPFPVRSKSKKSKMQV